MTYGVVAQTNVSNSANVAVVIVIGVFMPVPPPIATPTQPRMQRFHVELISRIEVTADTQRAAAHYAMDDAQEMLAKATGNTVFCVGAIQSAPASSPLVTKPEGRPSALTLVDANIADSLQSGWDASWNLTIDASSRYAACEAALHNSVDPGSLGVSLCLFEMRFFRERLFEVTSTLLHEMESVIRNAGYDVDSTVLRSLETAAPSRALFLTSDQGVVFASIAAGFIGTGIGENIDAKVSLFDKDGLEVCSRPIQVTSDLWTSDATPGAEDVTMRDISAFLDVVIQECEDQNSPQPGSVADSMSSN